jgi:hypothetical protein
VKHVRNLLDRARAARDAAEARELVDAALALVDELELSDAQRAEVYESFASRLQQLGDDERCESFMVKAIELEAGVVPVRPVILGTRHMFYALFLHRSGRLHEAAWQATTGSDWYARGSAPDDRELARVRADAARIVRDARNQLPNAAR